MLENLKKALGVLDKQQSKVYLRIFVFMVFNTIFELFSLVSFLPLLLIILNPDKIMENSILKFLYNTLQFEELHMFIFFAVLATLTLFFAKTLFSYLIVRCKAKFMFSLSEYIIQRTYSNVLRQSRAKKIGDELNKIVSLPFQFIEKILSSFFDLGIGIFLTLFLCLGLITYDFKVFVFLFIVFVPTTVVWSLFQRRSLSSVRSDLENLQPSIIQKATEVIVGKNEIIISGKGQFFIDSFSNLNNKYCNAMSKLATAVNSSSKTIELITIIGISALFLYFVHFEKDMEDIFLILSIYTISVYKLVPTFNIINVAYLNIQGHGYCIDLLAEPELDSPNVKKKSIRFENEVEFRNVSFQYPKGSFSLENVNFTIERNSKVAIIGESGSGKSTIVHLLFQFLRQNSGQILIDNNKQDAIDIASLFSYVPQSVFLFEGNIQENLTMLSDLDELTEKRLASLLESLGLSSMIKSFPQGLASIIHQDGSNISTGQRQRLGIARALLQDKEILVFDEVTSNLDYNNQMHVMETIQKSTQLGKTMIFVTHQKEIMDMCDVVLEVKMGGVYVNRK